MPTNMLGCRHWQTDSKIGRIKQRSKRKLSLSMCVCVCVSVLDGFLATFLEIHKLLYKGESLKSMSLQQRIIYSNEAKEDAGIECNTKWILPILMI